LLRQDTTCDDACNTLACNYDNNKCNCAEACSPELLSNAACDADCATPECQFDNGLCVNAR
jgi:hypothetical protein